MCKYVWICVNMCKYVYICVNLCIFCVNMCKYMWICVYLCIFVLFCWDYCYLFEILLFFWDKMLFFWDIAAFDIYQATNFQDPSRLRRLAELVWSNQFSNHFVAREPKHQPKRSKTLSGGRFQDTPPLRLLLFFWDIVVFWDTAIFIEAPRGLPDLSQSFPEASAPSDCRQSYRTMFFWLLLGPPMRNLHFWEHFWKAFAKKWSQK